MKSYNFPCSILLYTTTNNIFLGKDNVNFVKFYLKFRKTNRALRLYANYMVFNITETGTYLPSVRYKTSP